MSLTKREIKRVALIEVTGGSIVAMQYRVTFAIEEGGSQIAEREEYEAADPVELGQRLGSDAVAKAARIVELENTIAARDATIVERTGERDAARNQVVAFRQADAAWQAFIDQHAPAPE